MFKSGILHIKSGVNEFERSLEGENAIDTFPIEDIPMKLSYSTEKSEKSSQDVIVIFIYIKAK